MSTAYYWYRQHPYFGEFYPGKILNAISNMNSPKKYLHSSNSISLCKKYFPHGLSPHGLQMLSKYRLSSDASNEPIIEIIFELVRQLDFSDAPSRLTSLYASETTLQAEQWFRTFQNAFEYQDEQLPQSLWKINYETNARLYDAKLLNIEPDGYFSYLSYLDNAYRYWKGEMTISPLPELLIPYPVLVLNRVVEIHPSES